MKSLKEFGINVDSSRFYNFYDTKYSIYLSYRYGGEKFISDSVDSIARIDGIDYDGLYNMFNRCSNERTYFNMYILYLLNPELHKKGIETLDTIAKNNKYHINDDPALEQLLNSEDSIRLYADMHAEMFQKAGFDTGDGLIMKSLKEFGINVDRDQFRKLYTIAYLQFVNDRYCGSNISDGFKEAFELIDKPNGINYDGLFKEFNRSSTSISFLLYILYILDLKSHEKAIRIVDMCVKNCGGTIDKNTEIEKYMLFGDGLKMRYKLIASGSDNTEQKAGFDTGDGLAQNINANPVSDNKSRESATGLTFDTVPAPIKINKFGIWCEEIDTFLTDVESLHERKDGRVWLFAGKETSQNPFTEVIKAVYLGEDKDVDVGWQNDKDKVQENISRLRERNNAQEIGDIIFWHLLALAVDDDLWRNNIANVTDWAYCLGFDTQMLQDWCQMVRYVLEGNKLGAYCRYVVKTEQGKKYFHIDCAA